MNPEFDVIIVGSGPAGVSAAFPLVEAGLKVLMIDGGRKHNILPPVQKFLTARSEDNNQWKWMIGEKFHALKNHAAVSPKIRAPTLAHVFDGFEFANKIKTSNFVAIGSLAEGGLSNAWGCGVACLTPSELKEFPFDASDIERSYETVAKRMGISGCQEDDLSEYFGLDAWSQKPIQMDALHSYLFDNYMKGKFKLASTGFRIGRSRVAALSEDLEERYGCDSSGNCLWGCHRRSLYTASYDLTKLKKHNNFFYEENFVVDSVVRNGSFWTLESHQQISQERRSVSASKVLLAAGTLATTRLALKVLKIESSVPLLSSPTAAYLLWLPRMLGASRVSTFGLGQLSFSLRLNDEISAFGSTFSATGIPVSEFVRHLPLSRRYGVDILGGLLSSCLVGNVFLPGNLSVSKAMLTKDGFLMVDGGYSNKVPYLMAEVESRLRKAYMTIGAFLLPMSFTEGLPGGDIHYAGTLPMRKYAGLSETNAFGELHGLDGVHVVDGACLPSLSEKSHTLTIMANADRIGRKVSEMKFKDKNNHEA